MLNSLVACGELPSLFSNDEMDGLLQVGIEVWITKCMTSNLSTEAKLFISYTVVYCSVLGYTVVYCSGYTIAYVL